ncbi:MAG: SlyX family protein [Planctomycetota bacterium]
MTDLRDIEEKLAYVERHVEELDALVRELFDRLKSGQDQMARWREEVSARLEALGEDRAPEDDVPPHWGPK